MACRTGAMDSLRERRSVALINVILFILVDLNSAVLIRQEEHITTGGPTIGSGVSVDHHHTAEYCQWEVFEASCDSTPGGEERVIMMRSARYGLMKVGRCVAKNYGFVGCSTDVMGHMDSLCSGRRRCHVTIPDETMRDLLPCPKDFSPYLEASYQCVAVATSTSGHCSPNRRRVLPLTVDGTGYIASSVSDAMGHGSIECPWLLRASHGQRIAIHLLEFGSSASHSPSRSGQSLTTGDSLLSNDDTDFEDQVHGRNGGSVGCAVQLALIRERPDATASNYGSTSSDAVPSSMPLREMVVCGSSLMGKSRSTHSETVGTTRRREKTVYISSGNQLEVVITRPASYGSRSSMILSNDVIAPHMPFTFLLRYDVVGCATPAAPANGWLLRTGNDAITSGCNETHDRMSLSTGGPRRHVMHCDGTRWIGEIVNCTTSTMPASAAEPGGLQGNNWISLNGEWTSPLGILMVSAIGVIIGLIVGISLLFIVIVLMKRRTQNCLEVSRHVPEIDDFTSASAAMIGASAASSTAVEFRTDTASCRCITSQLSSCEPECDACAKLELIALRRDTINVASGASPGSATGDLTGGAPYGSIRPLASATDDVLLATRFGGVQTASGMRSGTGSDASSALLYGPLPVAPERNYFTRANLASGGDSACDNHRTTSASVAAVRQHFYGSPKHLKRGPIETPDVTSFRYDVRMFQSGSAPNC